MKRALCMILASLILLSFAACNNAAPKSNIKSPADFSGKKVAVQTDTTAAESIDKLIKAGQNIEVFPYESIVNCFDDLSVGRVDAVYVDSVVAGYYTAGADQYEQAWLSNEGEPMGICMRKDSTNLAEAVEAAVNTLYFNGKMSEIAKKHFGTDLSTNLRNVTEAPVIPELTEADLAEAGKFSVGLEATYAPMEYTTEDGLTLIGYDIDVANEIAALLGLEVNFINTAWDGIFAGLQNVEYDCIISAVSINPERQADYIMSEPYVSNALCIVVKK